MTNQTAPASTADDPEDRIKRFITAVVDAAIFDHHAGVAEYDPRNSGERLIGRLDLSAYRRQPRSGDSKYARSLYTVARWLYQTEKYKDD
jgi:hypothetical protein